MTYLITGATGLVGNAILKKCKKMNIDIHFLTTSEAKLNSIASAKGFYWNPSKNEIDVKAFDGVTHIIHLAGASVAKRWTTSYKKQILASRINTANLLFKTLQENQNTVEHFISASAIGIYPSSDKNYIENSNEIAKDFLGEVVQKWEEKANKFETLKIKVSKVRIGLVLSNRGGALPQMVAPVKFGLGSAFGSGQQWQSWVHISDLARLFIFVAQNNLDGVYNATAPNPVSQQKLIQTCANTLEKPLFMPNIPTFMVNLIFGEMGTILLSSQKVSSKKIEENGFEFQYATIENAVKNILT